MNIHERPEKVATNPEYRSRMEYDEIEFQA